MPKIEPVYEPREQDLGVFHGADDDYEEEDEGSRLPLLIVIGLLVLAAFGGVVWLAYQHGVERGMRDAPREVAGEPVPSASPAYDKIYQKPAPSDEDTANDDTAPPPPTPTMKSEAPPPAATVPAPSTPAPTQTVKAAAPILPPSVPKSAEPEPVATKPPAKLVPDTQTASTTAVATTPPPSTPAPVSAAPVSSGAYVLQIGAYKSEDEATSSWRSFKAKHSIAAGYSETTKQVDLGEKGTWYRLRIGPFATRDAADAVCAKLKADGGDCIAAKN